MDMVIGIVIGMAAMWAWGKWGAGKL